MCDENPPENEQPWATRMREENDRLRQAIRAAANELGVAQPDYPAPVANACNILLAALLPTDGPLDAP